MSKIYRIFVGMILLSSVLLAQSYTVSGIVTSSESGDALVGANVFIKNTNLGAATDVNGKYSIAVEKGTYTVVCSYIGFGRMEETVDVTNNMDLNFKLTEYEYTLSVTVLADRAKERETPVAFANVEKKDMELKLGSQDIPLVLNTTPSVYATPGGGGAGDSRINIRGFDQRNFAVMINGVPVNDMENGWVYWSNWDGVGDATSSIQVQRGLSATTLATGGVGGVMNIITDPSAMKSGALLKNEWGSGNFSKQTFYVHSGLIDKKFAVSMGAVRKTGAGYIDGAWTDAWAYYMGASYQVNAKNRIELYANGAPQRHGQRTWALNAATFSHELARELGYSETVLRDSRFREQGLKYNANWSGVSSSYDGQQWWNTSKTQRHSRTFINERENYFHKPIVNLNWYSQLSEKLNLYSTFYYSGGEGGGTGTFGSMRYDFSLLQRVVDWDATIARNEGNLVNVDLDGDGTSEEYAISTDQRNHPDFSRSGIQRNSVNNQWTYGFISKAFYKLNNNVKLSFGLDGRIAEIEHYREVRDLLGNDYYYHTDNEFDGYWSSFKKLGDKIDYNNTNTVNWLGGFVQGEYTKEKLTVYGTAGYTVVKYDFTDHFSKDASGNEVFTETDWIGGYQFKGGASYRATRDLSVFVNAGYISKVPIFDQVIDDATGAKAADPKNEKYLSAELGVSWKGLNNTLFLNGNFYYTNWKDRAQSVFTLNADGSDGLTFLEGVSQTHMGVEFEAIYQPVKYVRFDVAASVGKWEYTDDVTGRYKPNPDESIAYTYYLKDLKVGEAPQTQAAIGATFFPVQGMALNVSWRWYDDYYSDYEPTSRTDATDKAQVWQVPSYNLFDLHYSYRLPANIAGTSLTLFAHVFNVFDELYVADATDNSAFNGYSANGTNHSADDAEIYPGLPRTFNVGFSIDL